ncbi:MAG: M56 family metallopeptidase [Spirosomataceae bacterium]
MVAFFIQSGITISVFYGVYKLLLQKLTFFGWLRYYFLGSMVLSVVVPVLDFSVLVKTPRLDLQPILVSFKEALPTNLPLTEASSIYPNWIVVLSSIYGIGVAIGLLRIVQQVVSLIRLRQRTNYNGCFYELSDPIVPFSFFSWVFVNPDLHTEAEISAILVHEQVHVRQRHTVDILLAETMVVTFWFNPFVWLLRAIIKQNLEFLTDQHVLKEGISRQSYQYDLLKISQLQTSLHLSNHFTINHLKTRITMMNKMPSSPIQLFRFAIVLPVLTGLVLLFQPETIAQVINTETEQKSSPYYKAARAYYLKEDYKSALSFAQKAIQEQEDAYSHNLLGLCLTQDNQLVLAKEHFSKAMSLKPDLADSYINQAHVFALEGKPKQSIGLLEKALTLEPKSVLIYKNLGVAFDELGEWQKTISIWQKATKLFPEEAGSFEYNIGLRFAQHGQVEEGLKWLKEAARNGSTEAIAILKERGYWNEGEVFGKK